MIYRYMHIYILHVYGVFIYIKINYMYIRRCERARATSRSSLTHSALRSHAGTACIKFTYDKLYLTVTHAFCWFFCFINKASYYRSKDSFDPPHPTYCHHFYLIPRELTAVLEKENRSRHPIARSSQNYCSCFLWFNVCMCACVCICVYTLRCTQQS